MRALFFVAALAAAGCHSSSAAPPPGDGKPMQRVELLPPQGKLPELLAREAKRGNSYGLKPFVYLHASWCGPCRALSASLAHPLMVEAFRGTYIIEIDLDAWKDQLPAVGIKADGVPAFFELGADGHATGRMIDGGAWGDNVPKEMAPPLKKFFRS